MPNRNHSSQQSPRCASESEKCSPTRRLAVPALVLGLLCGLSPNSSPAQGAQTKSTTETDVMLILDASGSMWGQIGGVNKIVIARKVVADVVQGLADDSQIGLIAYGHRRDGDCQDVETIVPISTLDRAALIAKVEALNPKGKTPITTAITHALDAVHARKEPTTIVLVSDGLETCGGDPCKVVRDAKQSGSSFLLHVVGFDVAKEDVSSLECAAQAGGGLYFGAEDATALAAALGQAVAAPAEVPDGRLAVKVSANGTLADASVTVFPSSPEGAKAIASGRTYTSDQTNPRSFPVEDGTYDVTVTALGMAGASRRLEGVEVRDGKRVDLAVDFSMGELAVKVTSNGRLADATVSAISTVTSKGVASGRTYTSASSNPRVLKVPAGLYRVDVAVLGAKGFAPVTFDSVEVKPGQRSDLATTFDSATIKIGATSGGKLIDCSVTLTPVGETKAVASGRTYTSATSNPKSFEVPPGQYSATIKPLVRGAESKTIEVSVEAGGTVERIVDFPPGG